MQHRRNQPHQGLNLQNVVRLNIRNSFAILSYVFRMSANKLSYEKFTKELRKNYEKNVR